MGTLFYVVGASGAGKDSLLAYARAALGGGAPVFFAHRYITRPAEAGGENHVALSKAEFAQMQALDLFALSWEVTATATDSVVKSSVGWIAGPTS